MIDIKKPKNIYDELDKWIILILNNLKLHSDDEKFETSKFEVLNLIEVFRKDKLNQAIEELKKSQEWDKFTVAFYGETNAGKSTIIEALRIYFQEETKVLQQSQFKNIAKTYQDNKFKLELQAKDTNENILEYKLKIKNLINNFKIRKEELERKINQITSEDLKKKESSFFYTILSLLHIVDVQREIGKLANESNKYCSTYDKELKNLKNLIDEKDKELKKLETDIKELETTTYSSLQNFLDGQIIGDGRSDFTKESAVYNFVHNNQEFVFLDVPGIEGDETIVIEEISQAVKKAHAVFYVTSSVTPPQKGDENKQGTLEKIKEHLGAQTEVYTVFNKRVTNPMQLNKALISDDEEESLKVVDKKITEILGENYAGHKSISAKIAFLSLAECLLVETPIHNERLKFLNKFSTDDLIEKAQFDNMCSFITNELITNTKQKIKKSNYNKASNILSELTSILHYASKENFEPLYRQILLEVDDASKNLRNSLRRTKLDLESIIEKALREFENTTRKEIYRLIDSNISDNSFKNKLEILLKENLKTMVESISINIENQITKFQISITDVLENFKRRVNLAIEDYQTFDFGNLESKFNINLNIDNGISGWGVVGSLIGAGATAYWAITAGNIWNPAGWTMATLGIVVSAVAVLISFGKSIYKFFSDDYKKSEQRKSADENIENITDKIKPKMMENIAPLIGELSKLIDDITNDLDNIVLQRKMAYEYLDNTHNELSQLTKQIKREGEI